MENDAVNEDLTIMNERMGNPKVLDSRIFLRPIKDLKPFMPITIDIEDSLQDALMFMQMKQFGCVLVTKGSELAGIVTERDIIAKVAPHGDFDSVKVKDIMTPNPEAFHENDEIAYAVKAMSVGGYRHVPIVNESHEPVGMLSVKDVIRFIVDHFPDEIMNLPPSPIRKGTEREGA